MKTTVPMEKVTVMVGDIEMEAMRPIKLNDKAQDDLILTQLIENVDEIFNLTNLTTDYQNLKQIFIVLAMRVYRTAKVRKVHWIVPNVDDDIYIYGYLRKIDGIDDALLERAATWVETFKEVKKNSPLLQLREIMIGISEGELCQSWPHEWELGILGWVQSNNYLDECSGRPVFRGVTENEFKLMQEILNTTGKWFIQDDEYNLKMINVEDV